MPGAPTEAVEQLAHEIIELGTAQGCTVAFAESLTGGLCAEVFVRMPGASRVLQGAIVAYDTNLKSRLLGVDSDLLTRVGPVDHQVAKQMASGVRERCAPGSEQPITTRCIGIATTGVAGPDPDAQSGQLPGTVWIGVSSEQGTSAHLLQLQGTRQEIRNQTVFAALQLLKVEVISVSNRAF